MHLGPSRNAGLDAVPRLVVGDGLAEFLDKHRAFRSRTDQAHIAPKHVEKLGQFVQPGLAQKTPQPRPAWVVLGGPDGAAVLFGIGGRASNLETLESLSAAPDTLLT